jgi:nicotinamide riboside kinase
MGKCGPTGKTWLVNQLKGAGLRAIDVTEDAFEFVISRMTSGNYMKVDEANKVVYISLNDINDVYLQNNDCML